MSIQETYLQGIADAIRSKDGTTDSIQASKFAERISAIQVGVDTSDATATAGDIKSGKTAYVNGEKVLGSLIPNLNTATRVGYMRTLTNFDRIYASGTATQLALRSDYFSNSDIVQSGDILINDSLTLLGFILDGTVYIFCCSGSPNGILLKNVTFDVYRYSV